MSNIVDFYKDLLTPDDEDMLNLSNIWPQAGSPGKVGDSVLESSA